MKTSCVKELLIILVYTQCLLGLILIFFKIFITTRLVVAVFSCCVSYYLSP